MMRLSYVLSLLLIFVLMACTVERRLCCFEIRKDQKGFHYHSRAMDWHDQGVKQGYAAPRYDSGPRYDGSNYYTSDVLDMGLLEKKAQQGDVQAQYNLGVTYDRYDKDRSKTIEWFEKAAEKGHALAQFNLGYIYSQRQNHEGHGAKQDLVKAMEWFRRAADQGYQEAQYNLAMAYAVGHGVAKNDSKARVWFQKAADQGHIISKYNLGVMYSNGLGGKKDQTKALKWFGEAAREGLEGFAKAP